MANVEDSSQLTNYEVFQIERYGDILPSVSHTPESEMYESGIEELNRLSAYIDNHAELEIIAR